MRQKLPSWKLGDAKMYDEENRRDKMKGSGDFHEKAIKQVLFLLRKITESKKGGMANADKRKSDSAF